MSSFLSSLQPSPRPRPVSHGGLGGLLRPEEMERSGEPYFMATWPKRKKQRPPPLTICRDNEVVYTPSLQRSGMSSRDTISPWSPKTPSGWGLDTPRCLITGETHDLPSPATTMSYCCPDPQKVSTWSPAAQVGPKHLSLPPPVELAGSLLLPSQGFPPPPATPPRPVKYISRESSSSSSSSDPLPASSPSSFTSHSITDEADNMVNFSFAMLKRAKLPLKPETSRLYSENNNGTTTRLHISAPIIRGTHASKPLSELTTSELLDAIVANEPNVMVRQFVPELQKKILDLYDTAMASSVMYKMPVEDLKGATKGLMETLEGADELSKAYSTLLPSLEKCREQESREHETDLEEMKNRAELAESNAADLERALFIKDGQIDDVKHTLNYAVRTLRDYIQSRIPRWSDNLDDHDSQDIMLIINEHSDSINGLDSTRHIRIPAASYASNLTALREATKQNIENRGIVLEQGSLINDLTLQAEKYAARLETAADLVKSKDRELKMVREEKEALEQQLREVHNALGDARYASMGQRHVNERFRQRQLDQREEFTEKEHAYQAEIAARNAQLDLRDIEIGGLRAKLGAAREEALAQRGEVRNLIAEMQAKQTASEQSAEAAKGRMSKALSLLGKEKETLKKFLLPTSASTADLGFRKCESDMMTLSPDPRNSSKEVVGAGQRMGVQASASSITLRRDYGRHGVESDPFTDAASQPNPGRYGDNLQFTSATNNGSHSIATYRAMRSRLASSSRTSLSNAVASDTKNQTVDFGAGIVQAESPSVHIRAARASPGTKRILSGIPEQALIDVGDADSLKASSATSSDRAAYHDNVAALSLLEHNPVSEGGDKVKSKATARMSLGSDISAGPTTSEMYHDVHKVA